MPDGAPTVILGATRCSAYTPPMAREAAMLVERWFRDGEGRLWRLLEPDPPFTGDWGPLDEAPGSGR